MSGLFSRRLWFWHVLHLSPSRNSHSCCLSPPFAGHISILMVKSCQVLCWLKSSIPGVWWSNPNPWWFCWVPLCSTLSLTQSQCLFGELPLKIVWKPSGGIDFNTTSPLVVGKDNLFLTWELYNCYKNEWNLLMQVSRSLRQTQMSYCTMGIELTIFMYVSVPIPIWGFKQQTGTYPITPR